MVALIRSIVFLDAFLPESGDTIQKLTGPAAQDAIRATVQRGDLGVPPRPAQAFGVNKADREWVDNLCVPQPIGTFTSPIALSGARERIARKTYIRARLRQSRFRSRLGEHPGGFILAVARSGLRA